MTCGVYKLLHVKSGKFYIGSSSNIEKRIKRHFRELSHGAHHCSRVQKLYDKNPDAEFKVGKIVCNREEAYEIEQSIITENLDNKKFLNIGKGAIGGDNLTRNPRRLQIIENIRRGVHGWLDTMTEADKKWLFGKNGSKNGMYGKTHTAEAKAKISKANTGNSYCLGKKWSSESRKAYSEQLKGKRLGAENPFFGKTHSRATRKHLSKVNKGRKPVNQKRILIDGIQYISASEAARQLGIPMVTIAWRARNAKPEYDNYTYN
ncbi:MAG: NUMOD3 domain-containing DNA-binding protein [Bacteroidales bacterium]